MIKPLEEYSPEEPRVCGVGSTAPQPATEASKQSGAVDSEEVEAILAEVPQAERQELGEAIRRGAIDEAH